MNKHLRGLILLGIIVMVLFAIFFVGQFSRTHSRLQAYKASLRARGEKLRLQELAPDYATNVEANDSLIAFTNALGGMKAVIGIKSFRLHPATLEMRKFVGPGQARAVWMEDHPLWGTSKATVGQDTWDDLAAEILELKSTLAALRESLKNPATGAGPAVNWGGQQTGDFISIRSAAQWLAGAALCEVRQGNLDGALENLEALAGLGRMNRNDYRLVAQMIRVAVVGLGLAVTWEALQAPGWNQSQLEHLQKAWEGVELIGGLEKSFLAERTHGTELWAMLRSPGGSRKLSTLISGSSQPGSPQAALEQFTSEHVWLPAYKLTSIDDDELFYLQVMQAGIDSLRLLIQRHYWKEARQGFDQAQTRINNTSKTWQRFRYPLSMFIIPNLSKAADTAVRTDTERRLTVADIALRRFQLQHGALPKRLDMLLPDILAQVPIDPMSGGGHLHYQLKSDDDYCLYSIGEDGVDNGGDATPVANNFGLWEGRDAVWPKAVSPRAKVEVR